MISVKIEHDIPIPEQMACGSKSSRSILKSMKVGDSFIWPNKSRSNIYLYATMEGIKILGRTMQDGKYRVWRIK